MSYSLTSEADYVKQNTLKLKVRLEEQQRKEKKEEDQSKKWHKWQQEESKLTAREWFKKRTRVELLELMKIAEEELEYEFEISSSETGKRKLLECLLENFSIFKLNKMRKEYINRRLTNHLDTRKIEMSKHRREQNYIQRRLFEIFRHWLTVGKTFRIVRQRDGRVLSYRSYAGEKRRCMEWTGPYSVKAVALPYAVQEVAITFDPNKHHWKQCYLNSADTAQILVLYDECVYDYILSTGVRHLELQARWIVQDTPNRMRSLHFQRKQAELKQLAPIIVSFQNKCPNPDCKTLIFWHHLTKSEYNTSLHCSCHMYMLRENNRQWVTLAMGCVFVEYDGSVVLYRKCFCQSDEDNNVCADSHNTGCERFVAKGSIATKLQVDLTGLINQDLQREQWEQFIQSDRIDLYNTPARSLVNEYIAAPA